MTYKELLSKTIIDYKQQLAIKNTNVTYLQEELGSARMSIIVIELLIASLQHELDMIESSSKDNEQ